MQAPIDSERCGLVGRTLLLLVVVTWVRAVAVARQTPQEQPDTPYTATVSDNEARFVFPLPHWVNWQFGGPAARETTEFEWSVQVENGGKRYTFGIFVTKSPDDKGGMSQQPAAFFGRGKVLVAPLSGGEAVPVPEGHLYQRPGGWPNSQDYSRLVITIDDRATLRLLFYAQPSHAIFKEIYPDRPVVTHDVAITYRDYDYAPPAPALNPVWTKSYPKPVSVAVSENGRCVAIAGGGTLDVLDNSGGLLWQWNYSQTSRYIIAGAMAISPSCDAIALAGDPGYRYTWLVRRDGRKRWLHTTSTPLSVTFDHRGGLLAVGTGGSDVLLFTTAGELRWKTTLKCCFVEQLAFSEDNRFILVAGWGIGVLRIDGSVVWNAWEDGMNWARDLRTFVAWDEPHHGPGIGRIVALDEAGRPLWDKLASWVGAVVSPGGDKIVARINQNQNLTPEEFESGDEQLTSLQVLSRGGELLKVLPVQDGVPIAISPGGDRILVRTQFGVEGVELNGNRVFEIPAEQYGTTQVLVAGNFSGVLVFRNTRGAELLWYSLH